MRAQLAAVGICVLLVAGCRAPATDPLQEIARGLEKYPRYSIILLDMDVSGTFFKTYKHRYKVLYEQAAAEAGAQPAAEGTKTAAEEGPDLNSWDTKWVEVDRKFYQKHEPHLGLVLLSKGEGGNVAAAAFPPGYQYVGNPRYGNWRTDSRGGSFWEFYGKYYFFSRLLGGHGRPIYRSDYDAYRGYRQRRQPYFGPSNSYGTRGTYTRTSNPTFYQRQQVRQQAKSQRFSQRARSRTSGARSRSGGFGK